MSATIPTEEEYIIWREDAVTRFVLAVCRKTAGEVFDSWVQRSWQAETLDASDHIVARTRSDAYLALEQSEYSDWVARSETPDAEVDLPVMRYIERHAHDDSPEGVTPVAVVWLLLALFIVTIAAFTVGAVLF